MIKKTIGLVLGLTTIASAQGATLPPEKLLPSDTLFVATCPSLTELKRQGEMGIFTKLVKDPAMQPFVEKFKRKFTSDVLEPLEKELGVKISDYAAIIEGQITAAMVKNSASFQNQKEPDLLLILDSGSNSDQLKAELSKFRERWQKSGKTLRTTPFRGVDFHSVEFNSKDLDGMFKRAFPDAFKNEGEEEESEGEKIKITFAQSDSLLLIGSRPEAFEKLLVRQAGGLTPILGEYPAFEIDHASLLKGSSAYMWANAKTFIEMAKPAFEAGFNQAASKAPVPGLTPERILDALGINGVKTIAGTIQTKSDGEYATLSVGAPASARKGLLKLFTPPQAESGPPSYVPGDVAQFSRYRLDISKTFTSIESMITELSPQVAPIINMVIGMAGKDQDPNFDLRRDVINNLGNDVITYKMPPRDANLESLIAQPALTLMQSANADKLASSVKTVSRLLPLGVSGVKDREFLGRTIYSLALPAMPTLDGSEPIQQSVHFASSGSYLGVSTDVTTIENFLRGNSSGPSLAEKPGLREAADKVGGFNTGYFYYDAPESTLKVVFDYLRKSPDAFEEIFSGQAMGMPGIELWDADERREWVDFSLLPPFEQVSKYFGFTIMAAEGTDRAIEFRGYTPTPQSLR